MDNSLANSGTERINQLDQNTSPLFTCDAPSVRAALLKVKEELGKDAIILEQEHCSAGVTMKATLDLEYSRAWMERNAEQKNEVTQQADESTLPNHSTDNLEIGDIDVGEPEETTEAPRQGEHNDQPVSQIQESQQRGIEQDRFGENAFDTKTKSTQSEAQEIAKSHTSDNSLADKDIFQLLPDSQAPTNKNLEPETDTYNTSNHGVVEVTILEETVRQTKRRIGDDNIQDVYPTHLIDDIGESPTISQFRYRLCSVFNYAPLEEVKSGCVRLLGLPGSGKTTFAVSLLAKNMMYHQAQHVAVVVVQNQFARTVTDERLALACEIFDVDYFSCTEPELPGMLRQLKHKNMVLVEQTILPQQDPLEIDGSSQDIWVVSTTHQFELLNRLWQTLKQSRPGFVALHHLDLQVQGDNLLTHMYNLRLPLLAISAQADTHMGPGEADPERLYQACFETPGAFSVVA